MKKQKNYDKKVKNTRILLADYLILKSIAQKAGVSMSQALHRLIEHQAQLPLMTRIATKPAFRATAPVALRLRLKPIIATNGSKVTAFRIKPKGARYD